jgi:GT2 family glycosyltransferase
MGTVVADGAGNVGRGSRLAVVVATRDRSDSLVRTLDHLRRLPGPPEVVVVDNGSREDVAAAVARAHPWVRVIEAGSNLGAGARTVGARAVDAEHVAFCDDDSWWEPGSLERAADILDACADVALVAARVLVGSDGREDPVCARMAASPLGTRPGWPGPAVLGFVACGAVVRRADFLAAGGFESRLGVGGEEELLALDLAQSGRHLVYAPEVVARHHPSPARDPERRRRVQARNVLWCAWLRRPLRSALAVTLRTLRSAPRDRAVRAGLADALRGVGWIAARRRPVDAGVERRVRLLERRASAVTGAPGRR